METIIQDPNETNGSNFHYPPTQNLYPQKQLRGDSTFHYPETSRVDSQIQLGGSTFRYPETSTPDYSQQSSDSSFQYPETSTLKQELGGSTFHYPPTGTPTPISKQELGGSTFRYPESDPFPQPHTAAHSYTTTSNPNQAVGNYQAYGGVNPSNAQIPTAHVELEILEQMREILATGAHIGIEYVDQRRFRTGSWNSYAGHQIEDMADAIAALEACLVEHNNDYVRIFGIEPKAKRRLNEIMVQRPGGKLALR
ncbi:MAG: ribulose bisphosphate carboxylase small subunit [Cyanobacteria bacterium P01_D01_bin.116]